MRQVDVRLQVRDAPGRPRRRQIPAMIVAVGGHVFAGAVQPLLIAAPAPVVESEDTDVATSIVVVLAVLQVGSPLNRVRHVTGSVTQPFPQSAARSVLPASERRCD